ncbi:hypothetical protein ACF0H5_014919 [Mactra antiquata]
MNVLLLLCILEIAIVTEVTLVEAATPSVAAQIRFLLNEEKTLRQTLETRVQKLRQQVADLDKTIVPCVCGTPPPVQNKDQIAYTGTTGASTMSSLKATSVFNFNHDLSNVGGAFDASTGHFIAPYNGLYGVSLSVHTTASYYIRMELVADGHSILKVQTGHSSRKQINQGTNFVIANLTKGDEVWPRYIAGSGYLYGNNVPTFSAYLLHQF